MDVGQSGQCSVGQFASKDSFEHWVEVCQSGQFGTIDADVES